MSEALSSTEIEDVLSSIRRLVSEDIRPAPRPVINAVHGVGVDKLILTPALRVVQDDGAEDTSGAPPMFIATPRVMLLDRLAQPSGLELVVASVGAAVDAQAEQWEADAEGPSPSAGFQTDDWALPEQHAADDVVEPPLDETSADEATALAESDADHFDLLRSVAAHPLPGWAQQDDSHDLADAVDEPKQGTIEADAIWADAAEASVIAALAEDLQAEAGMAGPALHYDETTLREMVREVLREELAGTLGERITRNIRKLVRAEIARAVATQGLD